MTKSEKKKIKPEKEMQGSIEILEKNDMEFIRKLIEDTEENLQKLKHVIFSQELKKRSNLLGKSGDDSVVEGIFDGESMMSRDGKKFPVPPNYSSKSKLISGDMLKLTITPDGTFLFKQIGPIDRKKIIGELKETEGKYFVEAEGKKYNVLLASVTYYKIKPGDRLTIIVPKEGESDWAAIENIIDSNKKVD